MAAHSFLKKPSCGALTVIQPSEVWNAWSGTMFARALPRRSGTLPVARYSAMRVVPANSVLWNCDVWTRMPWPVRVRM